MKDGTLYSYILNNLDSISSVRLDKLLRELELNAMASFVKAKFKDPRSIKAIKTIIKEECPERERVKSYSRINHRH